MPTGHFAASQLVTVAAFAVCVQSAMRLPVSKPPASACHPVHAWLIAYAQKRTGNADKINVSGCPCQIGEATGFEPTPSASRS